MNDEVKKILNMVESGKISVEDGEKLISSLGNETTAVKNYSPSTKKFIKVEVYNKDDDINEEETKVKINIPLNLAKTMLRMNSIKNQISLNADDITIDFDEIISLLENDVDGELVNIESNTARVRIWIE
ncbi:hypothetical protein KHQ81_15065 [Mycoplasmatota bacterium]|nr:hypothetical protein KHQ81_15065 [Mycoplasmatota bacterium]